GGDANGHDGKGSNSIDGKAKHFAERVLRLARKPFVALVNDLSLTKADPGDHTANEAVSLLEAAQGQDHGSRHQAKIAGIDGNFETEHRSQDTIEKRSR